MALRYASDKEKNASISNAVRSEKLPMPRRSPDGRSSSARVRPIYSRIGRNPDTVTGQRAYDVIP